MRWPTWIALAVVAGTATLMIAGMVRRDEELGMLGGLMILPALGAVAFACG